MQSEENIPVFVKIVNGKTKCICHAHCKGCKGNCQRITVKRDRFEGFEDCFRRNKYGK